MKRYFILFLLFVHFSVFAQDEKYDAVYRKLIKEYTLNADGSVDYRFIKEHKLQTYRAFHNLYGETFVVYDTTCQTLKVNEVYTVMADGKRVNAPANSFNAVLPGFATNAPVYNSLREMVITHTGLERDAVINLDYVIHSSKGVYPFLMGGEILAEYEPVKELEIRVRVPKGTELYYRVFNLEMKPEKSTDQEFQVFTWKRGNVAAIVPEEGQQAGLSAYPRLMFSTSGKLSEAFTFLTNQPAFGFAINDGMKNEVLQLKNKYLDRFELATKIQEKVVDGMRLYQVPFRYAMYKSRTPEQAWSSNGATVVEKAVLLTALMRSAGIDATVAAVVRTAFSDEKIGTLSNVEDFVVVADLKERGDWYFSVTEMNNVNLMLSLTGRSFITIDPQRKIEIIDAAKPVSQVRVNGNFIVSSDPKLTGEVSIYVSGSIYPQAGMVRDKKMLKNALTGGLIKSDSAALKKSILNNENGFQTYTVQSDKPFRKDSAFYHFRLPYVSSGVESWNIHTLSEKRETAYEIPSPADETYSYTFTLPADFSLFTPAKKQVITNKAGTYTWELTSEKGKVTLVRSIKFNDRNFAVSVYPEFKVLMDSWNNPWYRELIFQVAKR